MNLEFSVDKLYETGWQSELSAAPSAPPGMERLPDGRVYPSVLKIQEIFANSGYELAIRYVQLFECYRASWSDHSGAPAGAVVGSDEREAAVYALAQLRKNQTVPAAVKP
ncbi:MAG TPA: hypothetical protein VHQ47_17185 [Phycisphaerae bacterium]|jgi:hypothetical protein|nr:hypothetical protein [Phycisphaerae bacterium]